MAGGDYDQRVPDAGDDEVGQLARSFNRMAMEVSSAREHQRQFIANVSHDLKTPLTSILGFSQILKEADGATSPMQQRAAQVINEEARRLQRLTVDLLDLSRLEAGQLQMRFAVCDLNALAGEALLRYAELPDNATISFLDQRMPGILAVHGDADRLTQVLVNLIDNAVKFCDPHGSVAVVTARAGTYVDVTVANTGAGIDEEDLGRVFQRFYRADHSRAIRTGGAGLGLAIVREIVAAHGGRVDAHSGADGWTRFTVRLPGASAERTFDRLPGLRDTEPNMASAP
jgi:signal transduction histidine kinase